MTTRGLILLTLLSLSAGASSSNARLRKCCATGEVFVPSSKRTCVRGSGNAMELYPVGHEDVNALCDASGICKKSNDLSVMILSRTKTANISQKSSCIDVTYSGGINEPVIVQFPSSKIEIEEYESLNSLLPRMLSVRRCCKRNSFYDVRIGSCVPMDDVFDGSFSERDEFLSLLPTELNQVEFLNVSRSQQCVKTAMFAYEIDAKDIVFANGTLQVNVPSARNRSEWVKINSENSCLELTPDFRTKRRLAVRVCRSLDHCQYNKCIARCCSEATSIYSNACRELPNFEMPRNFYETFLNHTGVKSVAEYGWYRVSDSVYFLDLQETWHLTPEGHINSTEFGELNDTQFCLELLHLDESLIVLQPYGVGKVEKETSTTRYLVNSTLEGISCFFLLLTLLVYGCLPVLQNLHGKTLMCHSASLLMAYTCLSIIPWVTPAKNAKEPYATTFCAALGYTMLFSFLSAFSWLNVMCFDIWRTFGSLRGNMTRGQSRGKRFLFYCLYAWGLSMFFTIFGILNDTLEIFPENLRPNFGPSSCWFGNSPGYYGELLFFRGPIAIQLTLNVVFFILTAEQCSKVKADIRRVADPLDPRSKRFHADKTIFVMNVKLFIVMGITWIAEIVSSFVDQYVDSKWGRVAFYATDAVNCLQGLLIFLLFVMKRRVHQALKKRLGFDGKKKSSVQKTSTLQNPDKVKKSASNSTLVSSFGVSLAPSSEKVE